MKNLILFPIFFDFHRFFFFFSRSLFFGGCAACTLKVGTLKVCAPMVCALMGLRAQGLLKNFL